MEKYLIYLFLMSQIVRNGYILVGKFGNQELQYIHHRLYHLYLIDVLMAHDVANHVDDVKR